MVQGRRLRAGVAVVALLVASVGVIVTTAGPAAAATWQVHDEASFDNALWLGFFASEPVVIEITAGFTITGAPNYDGSQPLTINGNDHFISGGVAHRFLSVDSTAALTVNDLAFSNGRAVGGGGAIIALGDVTVTGSTFTNNSASQTGGAIQAGGSVTVEGSTFTYNSTTTTNADGGAIDAGVVTVTDSTFASNTAPDEGGAIMGGFVRVTDSTIGGNTAGRNGGAIGAVEVTATGTTFTGNTATAGGGAIHTRNGGPAQVTNSTFTTNNAATGGAIDSYESTAIGSTFTNNSASQIGGAIRAVTSASATGSTFTGNTAAVGGAIRAGGSAEATNSTFTGNTATNSSGGAISATGVVGLVSATVVANSAGGGANIFSGGGVESYGSVVAVPLGGGGNCSAPAGATTSHSYADDLSCGFADPTDDQALGNDPQLLALGDNGGPTRTRAPQVTSPLVDAIPAADCDPAVPLDQRGQPRPADGNVDGTEGCDIGAVEVQPPAARPDGRIKRGSTGPLRGNNVYNTLTGQTVAGSAARGGAVTYYASVQNDAGFSEPLRVQGQPSNANFGIVYRNPAGANVTAAVTNGTYTTPALAPGATHPVRIVVTVRATAPPNASLARTLTAFSTTRPLTRDSVRFTTSRS